MPTARSPGVAATRRPPWAFKARFKSHAFGWRGSRLAVQRIDEALREIERVAQHDTVHAAEGAVALLERLSPALADVDSSSGSLGNATSHAVETLVPVIAQAPVDAKQRKAWLERLYQAVEDDGVSFIETLTDHWGTLCATPDLASEWADRLLPVLRSVLAERRKGTFAFFQGTSACYSALFAAGRHAEILELLESDRKPIWSYLVWAGKVLVARGEVDEAIALMESEAGSTASPQTLARFAEDALIQVGRRQEAFDGYALRVHRSNTHLGTFRALNKRYPEIPAPALLRHLVAHDRGEEGKWFATAKTLKLYDDAARLAWASPCDPRTLTRAALSLEAKQPEFARQCAMAAVHWISLGHGYELTGHDLLQPAQAALRIGAALGLDEQTNQMLKRAIEQGPRADWMRRILNVSQPSR